MKIAFVLHDYPRAGVGQTRYVKELARRFRHEHEVHVFANRIEETDDAGIHFHRVPAWRKNLLTTVISFAVNSTLQIGKGFDIVHSQGFCGFYGNIFTAHICNRAWHRALQVWEGGVTLREGIFNAFATTLEHGAYRWSSRAEVIAVSKRVAEDVRRYYGCPGPMHVIYHGVNLDVFSPENRSRLRAEARQELGFRDGDYVYLFVGHLRKGLRRSIQALSKLQQGHLLCVSSTPSAAYLPLARELGLERRVHFPGFTERVERMYAAADALLLPSPYDSFGMVVTEAMAMGLPVVVSREAGVSEIITNGGNGLLLDDLKSETELANCMGSLQRNSVWADLLGKAGSRTVQCLTWDSVADQTMAVYEGLLRKPQPCRVPAEKSTTRTI